jgi:hypothetical protein
VSAFADAIGSPRLVRSLNPSFTHNAAHYLNIGRDQFPHPAQNCKNWRCLIHLAKLVGHKGKKMGEFNFGGWGDFCLKNFFGWKKRPPLGRA